MKKVIFLLVLLTAVFFITSTVMARVGVGVNLGKIEIDEPLKAGGIYEFPQIGVINTGDEPAEYRFAVTYHEGQQELKPSSEWLRFGPSSFLLEAGASQSVEVTLVLPLNTAPGRYFAYLEAYPVIPQGPGTTVGVAAATKTYFTVEPANIWQAIFHRAKTLIRNTQPLSYAVAIVVLLALVFTILRRLFSFRVTLKKK